MKNKVPVICYSRVSGYYSEISKWNKGKKEEFRQRKHLVLNLEKKYPEPATTTR